ncbi:MAG: MaoC family dehydratase [Nocardioides sp.]
MIVDGPYLEDLVPGTVLTAPSITLDEGAQAVHRSILGDRLPVYLDATLSEAVTGSRLAHPGLVWDVAIGQSSVATRQVVANLFYRGLALRRPPALGDTLTSSTEVRGRRVAGDRPDRPPRGLVVLRTVTCDQDGRTVLDFERCALVARRDAGAVVPDSDWREPTPLDDAPTTQPPAWLEGWDLGALSARLSRFSPTPPVGTELRLAAGDVVSGAPELARLTLNIAAVHHDRGETERLVYGGHTVGIALGQAARALPRLATVTGWRGCDHLGPVHEGDTLHSLVSIVASRPVAEGVGLLTVRSQVVADGGRPVLDWTFEGLAA